MAIAASDSHLESETSAQCDSECECWGHARQSAAMTRVSPDGLWPWNCPNNQKFPAAAVAAACPAWPGNGAGDGNRTHVSSLGSCSSTIELHPRGSRDIKESRGLLAILWRRWPNADAGDWAEPIR